MSLAIYILRNYMVTLPREVLESDKIDGATHIQTFWRLIVPMSVLAVASFAVVQFQPITVAVAGLIGQQNQSWQPVTVGGPLSMIIVFLSRQRFLVRGLTAGSVKG
jgi:alpha-glucoside transport system permease protein